MTHADESTDKIENFPDGFTRDRLGQKWNMIFSIFNIVSLTGNANKIVENIQKYNYWEQVKLTREEVKNSLVENYRLMCSGVKEQQSKRECGNLDQESYREKVTELEL